MTNPYQTPQGQLTDDDQAYGDIKFFSPSGRINRLRYWAHGMLMMLAFYPIMGIGMALMMGVSPLVGGIVLAVSYIAVIVVSFIIMIQRLHDLNKSGWMSLLAFVPLANIYLIVLLIFFKGTPGRNDYGLQTPPNKAWHWILALVMPILIIGILAAVAIPAYHDYVERAKAQQSLQQDSQSYEYQDTQSYEYTDEAAPDSSTEYTDESTPDSSTEYTDEAYPTTDEAESNTAE